MDGYEGYVEIVDPPGKLSLYVHFEGKHKYVYQARRFVEDGKPPLIMDFVQVLGRKEEL
jgi:hypothetical protein